VLDPIGSDFLAVDEQPAGQQTLLCHGGIVVHDLPITRFHVAWRDKSPAFIGRIAM